MPTKKTKKQNTEEKKPVKGGLGSKQKRTTRKPRKIFDG